MYPSMRIAIVELHVECFMRPYEMVTQAPFGVNQRCHSEFYPLKYTWKENFFGRICDKQVITVFVSATSVYVANIWHYIWRGT